MTLATHEHGLNCFLQFVMMLVGLHTSKAKHPIPAQSITKVCCNAICVSNPIS